MRRPRTFADHTSSSCSPRTSSSRCRTAAPRSARRTSSRPPAPAPSSKRGVFCALAGSRCIPATLENRALHDGVELLMNCMLVVERYSEKKDLTTIQNRSKTSSILPNGLEVHKNATAPPSHHRSFGRAHRQLLNPRKRPKNANQATQMERRPQYKRRMSLKWLSSASLKH